MKRSILCVSLTFALLLIFVSCNSANVSPKALSIGKQAVKAVDTYLDRTMSQEEVHDELNGLYYEMEYAGEYTLDQRMDNQTYADDYSLRTEILIIGSLILHDKGDTESYNKIIEDRNRLAAMVGEPSR